MANLLTVGVPDMFLTFLGAYLEPRFGHVSVEGVLPDVFEISNTVCQGLVLLDPRSGTRCNA